MRVVVTLVPGICVTHVRLQGVFTSKFRPEFKLQAERGAALTPLPPAFPDIRGEQ